MAEPNLGSLLDLVALGTVADVVALDHNNRILVSQGLKRMRAGNMRPGIRALFQVAKRDWRKGAAFRYGLCAGPRINAAGRLDDMSVGIACLLAEHEADALALAEQLNHLNIERREIEQSMLHDALAASRAAGRSPNHAGGFSRRFPPRRGVGIVASRLKERFYRPAIVFARPTMAKCAAPAADLPACTCAMRSIWWPSATRPDSQIRRPRHGRGLEHYGAATRCVSDGL